MTKIVIEKYGVVIDPEGPDRRGDLVFSIPMKADVARASKWRLSVLLICRLRYSIPDEALVGKHEERIKWPSITDPRDIERVKMYVNMDLQEMWVFDTISGEVIHKEIWQRPLFELRAIVENGASAIVTFRRSFRQIEAKVGDIIDGEWRIESIGTAHLQIRNVRSDLRYRLTYSALKIER